MKKVQMNIFGCGGTGINIARKMELPEVLGFPIAKKVYFDTSDRNVTAADMKDTFLIEGMNGAGKDQEVAHKGASDQIDDLLRDFKPGVMNVVIFGAAGGSGGVLGTLLFEEMARREIPCIALVIGNTTSKAEAINTKNTLRTLRGIGSKGASMTMMYFENGTSADSKGNNYYGNREQVDGFVMEAVHKIALLTGEQNIELDRSDIHNWLYYTKSTKVPTQLTDLVITDDLERAKVMAGKVISTACLLSSTEVETPALRQLYSTVGYLAPEVAAAIDTPLNSVFMITPVMRDDRISALEATVDSFQDTAAFTQNFASIKDEGKPAEDDSGFYFG